MSLHANRAVRYAEEAIELAKHTQNRRLLAEAYIARGSTAADEFFEEWRPRAMMPTARRPCWTKTTAITFSKS